MINLRMLKAVCGEHYFQNIKLVTSMWGTVPSASMAATFTREVEFNTSPDFWLGMIEKGAHYARWDENMGQHYNTAKQVVEMCRSKLDTPILNILLEMQKGATIEQTTAGRILTEELRKRQEKERKAIEEEEEELRILERERMALQGRLQSAGEGRRREAELAAQQAYARQEQRPDSWYGPPLPPPGAGMGRRWSEPATEMDPRRDELRSDERRRDERRRDDRHRSRRSERPDSPYLSDYERPPRHDSNTRVERRSRYYVLVRPITHNLFRW